MGRGGRGRWALARTIAAIAAIGVAACVNATAGDDRGPWPDSSVAALWPTFSSLPSRETGAGGAADWEGEFSRCVASPKVSYSYACEYRDERGRLGYACLQATEPLVPISRNSIDARVAPGDPTYAAEKPTLVCYSALAYRLSLG
jgi:hypothetical protein